MGSGLSIHCLFYRYHLRARNYAEQRENHRFGDRVLVSAGGGDVAILSLSAGAQAAWIRRVLRRGLGARRLRSVCQRFQIGCAGECSHRGEDSRIVRFERQMVLSESCSESLLWVERIGI